MQKIRSFFLISNLFCLDRVSAVDACRWVTKSIPHAPYVTTLPWVSHYGCFYVVHGDDITSDSNGEDCYRFVKAAGRFRVVKRTPGISTTDLVGRMLLCTKGHFIKSLRDTLLARDVGPGSSEIESETAQQMLQRIKDYATDETGHQRGPEVWSWSGTDSAKVSEHVEEAGTFENVIAGQSPKPDQRIVYVDGGFDLFSSGHIEFLRLVVEREETEARSQGWYDDTAREKRVEERGSDYGPVFVVAGIHDDGVINHWKGLNYPIMNIFERGLCVLQCRVSRDSY
jgi:ethanolamine-phosphate cytidylyltransferase